MNTKMVANSGALNKISKSPIPNFWKVFSFFTPIHHAAMLATGLFGFRFFPALQKLEWACILHCGVLGIQVVSAIQPLSFPV